MRQPQSSGVGRKDRLKLLLIGAVAASLGRGLLIQLLLFKFRRDVRALNSGDYSQLLSAYADDFVLHFHEGDHRWAGTWRGKPEFERFLQNFTAAKVNGELVSFAISGPVWALKLWVRFDDHADTVDGRRVYQNQSVLLLQTRFGKIVEQWDFYTATEPIAELDRELTRAGIQAVARDL